MQKQVSLFDSGYRSGARNIWEQFIRPALAVATSYRRAAGYFDSSVFSLNLQEWCDFLLRGGQIQLVCSPSLFSHDINALYRGLYEGRTLCAIGVSALRDWARARGDRGSIGPRILSWLVANNRMDIFIAIPNQAEKGIYHEKFGIFELINKEVIAFSGSSNETSAGFEYNFERLEIFSSLNGDVNRKIILKFSGQYEALVKNSTSELTIHTLHQAFLKNLFCFRDYGGKKIKEVINKNQMKMNPPPEIIRIPAEIILRNYQKAAVEAWLSNGGRGIFAMVTGAGKTITALAVIEKIFERKGGSINYNRNCPLYRSG